MHSRAARIAFTIASFLPLGGVFGLALGLSMLAGSGARTPDDWKVVTLVVFGGAMLIALVQIALGAIVGLHTAKRPDLTPGQRAGWTIACVFVGSFALPLFAWLVLPGAQASPPR